MPPELEGRRKDSGSVTCDANEEKVADSADSVMLILPKDFGFRIRPLWCDQNNGALASKSLSSFSSENASDSRLVSSHGLGNSERTKVGKAMRPMKTLIKPARMTSHRPRKHIIKMNVENIPQSEHSGRPFCPLSFDVTTSADALLPTLEFWSSGSKVGSHTVNM